MTAGLYIACVSGFSQTRNTYHGILSLREKLVDKYSHGLTHRVDYLTWQASFDMVANDLGMCSVMHGISYRVLIVGYSYGGWGAIQLARAFEKLGQPVDCLVLCDPVGRPWWWPRPLPALSSLLGRDRAPRLLIPPNVERLVSYYQRNNRPQGHALKTAPETKVYHPIKLDREHSRMDDAPEFHGRVVKEARILASEGGGINFFNTVTE